MNELSLIALSVMAAVLLAVTVIRTVRNRKKAIEEQLARLGFYPVPEDSHSLLSELRGLAPNQRQQVPVGTVYRRTGGYAEMYAFYPDVATNSSSTIAVRVPNLNLPLFRLFAKVNVGGMLGGLINELVLRTLGAKLQTSEWTGDPVLKEHYFLFSEDPPAVEKFIIEKWGSLLRDEKDRVSISGRGDLLAFSRSVTAQQTRRNRQAPTYEDPFASFVQRVDTFARSIRTNQWDRPRRSDHTVA